jgi:hypothetical protein
MRPPFWIFKNAERERESSNVREKLFRLKMPYYHYHTVPKTEDGQI